MGLRRRELFRWGAVATVGAGAGLTASTTGAEQASAEQAGAPVAVRRSVLLRYSSDGAVRWQTSVPLDPNERGSEVMAGGGQIFLVQGGALRSFDLATGAPRWVRPLAAVTSGSPLVMDGLILVVLSAADGRDVRVSAYDQDTGRPRWTHDDGADFIVLYPVRAGLVIVQERYRTITLETATGRIQWTAPVPGHDDGGSSFAQVATSPTTVVQGGVTTTAALDASTGRRLWARALLLGSVEPVLTGSVAVLAPQDFGGAAPGGVVALDARTGAHRWTVPAADESGGVVAAGFGAVVAVTGGTVQGGRTTAVATETGRVLWSAPVPADTLGDAPTALTARGVGYVEDLWHDRAGHQRRVISLVNRRLDDGRVLYRHPIAEPIAQGLPPLLHGRYLPLILPTAGNAPPAIRLFDLATHRVRFTVVPPRWPTATPLALPDGSVVSLTADLTTGVAA
jgi:outer membrane protein assembly factor BamB